MSHMIDDGAVFYLNGAEWFRVNMPDGPVNALTFASPAAVTDAAIASIEFTEVMLRPGTNSWAVEDGKIIAVGELYGGELSGASGLFSYHPDGKLDFSVIEEESTFYAVAVQGDRKVLVGKTSNTEPFPERAGLVRFHPDGRLDTTFKPCIEGNGLIFEIAMDRGKILVSGIFDAVNGLSRPGLVRLYLDGSVDASFVPPELQYEGPAHAVYDFAIQPGGRMVIVGTFIAADGLPQFGLAALFPDGSLDPRLNDGTMDFGAPRSVAIDLNGDVYAVRSGILRLYGTGEFSLEWRKNAESFMEILWPGDREDLRLECAEDLEYRLWSLVTEPTHQVEGLNATRISRGASQRVFRLFKRGSSNVP